MDRYESDCVLSRRRRCETGWHYYALPLCVIISASSFCWLHLQLFQLCGSFLVSLLFPDSSPHPPGRLEPPPHACLSVSLFCHRLLLLHVTEKQFCATNCNTYCPPCSSQLVASKSLELRFRTTEATYLKAYRRSWLLSCLLRVLLLVIVFITGESSNPEYSCSACAL